MGGCECTRVDMMISKTALKANVEPLVGNDILDRIVYASDYVEKSLVKGWQIVIW